MIARDQTMTNPTQPSSVSRWFRVNLWLHRWAGLVATLPFLVLCITGSILIFHEEIDKALGVVPESAHATDAAQRPLHEAMTNVLAAHPGERALSIGIDPENHPGVLLVVTGKDDQVSFDGAELRYADLVSGKPSDGATAGKNFTRWLLELHAQWFLGPVGELLGALVALLVMIALFSGIVVYAPYVRRVALGVLRRGRSARLLQLDLHNTIGALTLGWAFVVSATGFLLGFSTLAIGVWQATALGEFRQQAPDTRADRLTQPARDRGRSARSNGAHDSGLERTSGDPAQNRFLDATPLFCAFERRKWRRSTLVSSRSDRRANGCSSGSTRSATLHSSHLVVGTVALR